MLITPVPPVLFTAEVKGHHHSNREGVEETALSCKPYHYCTFAIIDYI